MAFQLIRIKPYLARQCKAPSTQQEVRMRTVFALMTAAVLAACVSFAVAQSDKDHAAHHPEGASAPLPGAKKPAAAIKAPAAKPQAASPAASAASSVKRMGMGGADMKQMRDDMHKPGGMHDRKHGKDGKMMGAMPAASAASR
jgi:hypothetical protein